MNQEQTQEVTTEIITPEIVELTLEQKAEQANDKYLRLYAEYENYRKFKEQIAQADNSKIVLVQK